MILILSHVAKKWHILGLRFGSVGLQNISTNHCMILPWSPYREGTWAWGSLPSAMCSDTQQGAWLSVGAPGGGRPMADLWS